MKTQLKSVIIGDGAVGKTCMLMTYANNQFPQDYVPTAYDNYDTTLMFEGKQITLSLWDTAGEEEYDRLRPLSYPGTSVFTICFSLINKNSFDNVSTKWIPEMNTHVLIDFFFIFLYFKFFIFLYFQFFIFFFKFKF
jgi:Ras-related C3 botulinum toxin substrate 1